MVFILDPDEEDIPVRPERGLRIIDESRSRELAQLTAEFLARGGQIEVIPTKEFIRKPKPYRPRRTEQQYVESVGGLKEARESDKDADYRRAVLRAVNAGVVGYTNCALATGLSVRIVSRIAEKYNIRVKRVTKKEMAHE